MLQINDLKTGVIFEDGGEPWQILEYQHSKTGRAGAVLRTKIKNLITNTTINKTFQASEKFPEVRLERKRVQYLYQDGGYVFMDTTNYNQFTLGQKIIGDACYFMKEGDEIQLVFYKENPIMIDLPIKVSLKVTEAMEADRGNTATAATKKVTLETGLEINVPMFIKTGENVIIDTRTTSYVERAK